MGIGLIQNTHFAFNYGGSIVHQHLPECKEHLVEIIHKLAEFIQLHWSWYMNSIGAWYVTTWFVIVVFLTDTMDLLIQRLHWVSLKFHLMVYLEWFQEIYVMFLDLLMAFSKQMLVPVMIIRMLCGMNIITPMDSCILVLVSLMVWL